MIAVDVGSENDMDFTNYGDCLSGWWLLWKRFTGRWTGRIKVGCQAISIIFEKFGLLFVNRLKLYNSLLNCSLTSVNLFYENS